MTTWQTMDTAPKDRPILGWCVHDSDPYHFGPTSLTTYGAHCEGLGHVEDGAHVLEWGGGFTDVGEYGSIEASCPDWWFRVGSEFEEVAAPVLWAEITQPEALP